MRSVILLLAACGSASSPSNAPPPTVAADEVATPTEQASAPPQAQGPSQAVRPPAKAPTFPATCHAIARELETLTKQFAQLASYRAVDQKDCRISYKHNTLPPSGRGGGYSAGIPRPEPDGIFLYISIWDPNATDNWQLDTQPASFFTLGNRRVTIVISEGDKTKRAAGAIQAILERHGMTR